MQRSFRRDAVVIAGGEIEPEVVGEEVVLRISGHLVAVSMDETAADQLGRRLRECAGVAMGNRLRAAITQKEKTQA